MQMIIGAGFADASDKRTRAVINPATGEVVDTVPEATSEDVSRAVAIAVEAQKSWAARTTRERTTGWPFSSQQARTL